MATTKHFALLFCLTLVLAATAAEARTERHSFDVRPGGTLELDTDRGRIEVTTDSGSKVRCEVRIEGSQSERFSVDFGQQGDRVMVEGDYDGKSLWGWGGNHPKVEFLITVPRRFNLDLRTSGGSIKVADLDGDVTAKTSGGSLRLGNIRGTVVGKTSGGSIELEGSEGDAEISTSGGSIRIGDVDGRVLASTSGGSIHIDQARGNVEAETSGGSIRVDEVQGDIRASTSGGSVTAYISKQPTGDCRLTTSGGRVQVYLASGIGVDLDARASGGKVRSDFEVRGGRASKTSLSGEIDGGGPQLYLRSSGGGVSIERR